MYDPKDMHCLIKKLNLNVCTCTVYISPPNKTKRTRKRQSLLHQKTGLRRDSTRINETVSSRRWVKRAFKRREKITLGWQRFGVLPPWASIGI